MASMTCKMLKSYEQVKRKYKQSISKEVPTANKWGLAPRQLMFVLHYADGRGPAFLNAVQSAKLAGYSGKSVGVNSRQLLRLPKVVMALKELLGTDRIDRLISEGIQRRLEDPESRNWLPTADFVAKVRGDYSPEKHINMNMTPEDRNKKYEDILKLVNRTTNVDKEVESKDVRGVCVDASDAQNAIPDMQLPSGTH